MISRLARLLSAAVLLGCATVLAGPRLASAECTTSFLTGKTTCLLYTPARPAKLVALGDGRTSSFEWVQVPFDMDPETRARSSFCERTTSDGLTTTVEYGDTPIVFLRNKTTGEQVIAPRILCLFPGDAAPEPPPPPPSPAEFVEAARASVTTQTAMSPSQAIGGLTGLDTWLWCDNPGEVQVDVALRGWTAEATVDAVGFRWSVDGLTDNGFTATTCGSESAPAASWTPETKGAYVVTLSSTWAGSWTLAYQGVDAGVFPLGPYDFASAAVPYPVGEYRGVLTPPEDQP